MQLQHQNIRFSKAQLLCVHLHTCMEIQSDPVFINLWSPALVAKPNPHTRYLAACIHGAACQQCCCIYPANQDDTQLFFRALAHDSPHLCPLPSLIHPHLARHSPLGCLTPPDKHAALASFRVLRIRNKGKLSCVALLPGVHDNLDTSLLFLVKDLVGVGRLRQRQLMGDDLHNSQECSQLSCCTAAKAAVLVCSALTTGVDGSPDAVCRSAASNRLYAMEFPELLLQLGGMRAHALTCEACQSQHGQRHPVQSALHTCHGMQG